MSKQLKTSPIGMIYQGCKSMLSLNTDTIDILTLPTFVLSLDGNNGLTLTQTSGSSTTLNINMLRLETSGSSNTNVSLNNFTVANNTAIYFGASGSSDSSTQITQSSGHAESVSILYTFVGFGMISGYHISGEITLEGAYDYLKINCSYCVFSSLPS